MPIQKPSLPAPSPLDAADPANASEAVRRRIRRRWERRRAETAGRTELSLMSSGTLGPTRRVATIADTNLCLADRDFAKRRFALVHKAAR